MIERDYEKLYRVLTDQPEIIPGKVGNLVKLPPLESPLKSNSSSTPFNVPLHRNAYFIERENILEKLRKNLEAGKQTALTQAVDALKQNKEHAPLKHRSLDLARDDYLGRGDLSRASRRRFFTFSSLIN